MSVLVTNNDDDGYNLLDVWSWAGSRKNSKLEKDEQRSIERGKDVSFKPCGLIIDARFQLIEVSQIKDMKWRGFKNHLDQIKC